MRSGAPTSVARQLLESFDVADPKTTVSDPADAPPRSPPRRNSGIIQRARLEDVLAVGAGEAMKDVEPTGDHPPDPDRY